MTEELWRFRRYSCESCKLVFFYDDAADYEHGPKRCPKCGRLVAKPIHFDWRAAGYRAWEERG